MHEVLVNRLGLSLPRKSVVRLNDRPDMTSDVYRGRKTTQQQQQQQSHEKVRSSFLDQWELPILIIRMGYCFEVFVWRGGGGGGCCFGVFGGYFHVNYYSRTSMARTPLGP